MNKIDIVILDSQQKEGCWVIDSATYNTAIGASVTRLASLIMRRLNTDGATAVYVAVTKTISTEKTVRTATQATIKVEDGSSIYNALVEALSRAI